MFYLNRVIVAGSLKSDPDIRYTPHGKPMVVFTLALPSEGLNHKSFPSEEVSIRVMMVGEDSEAWVKQNRRMGQNVLVEGGLVQRRWETGEGRVKREIGIVAHSVRDIR